MGVRHAKIAMQPEPLSLSSFHSLKSSIEVNTKFSILSRVVPWCNFLAFLNLIVAIESRESV